MTHIPMQINPKDVLHNAREANWDGARLAQCFRGLSSEVCQALLDRSAIITDVREDGSFQVYQS